MYIVGPFPEIDFWPRNKFRNNELNYTKHPLKTYLDENKDILFLIDKLLDKYSNIEYYDVAKDLCDNNNCTTTVKLNGNEIIPIYYDDDHLNPYGNDIIADALLKSVKMNNE